MRLVFGRVFLENIFGNSVASPLSRRRNDFREFIIMTILTGHTQFEYRSINTGLAERLLHYLFVSFSLL